MLGQRTFETCQAKSQAGQENPETDAVFCSEPSFFETEIMLNGLEERFDKPTLTVTSGEVSTASSKGSRNIETFFTRITFYVTPTQP